MTNLLSSPIAAILISLAAYLAGARVRRRTGWALANPLAVAAVLVGLFIALTPLELADYLSGTQAITLFLIPATTVLALKIDSQWARLRANFVPIVLACAAGSVTSVASVWLLCRIFALDAVITASLLPKSVTSAIAIELSQSTGGIGSLTVSVVVLTGIISAVLSPFLARLFGLKNRLALGLAMGMSGHAMGTARAIELGEVEGAVSGIALTLSGILTGLLYLAIF